jgi:cytosine/uracil/thiamine/allantoin permease
VDVAALFDPPGRGRIPDVSWPALVAFVLGMVATWSCEYGIPAFLQGPVATAIGGVDLSWLGGAVVAGVAYLALERRRRTGPARPARR